MYLKIIDYKKKTVLNKGITGMSYRLQVTRMHHCTYKEILAKKPLHPGGGKLRSRKSIP